MNGQFFDSVIFENKNFRTNPPETGDYEECRFIGCDFSDSSIADIVFIDCEFNGCNFSLTKLTQTSFREVKFINCKLLGLHIEDCNVLTLSMTFESSSIELCSFIKLRLRNTGFSGCKIIESDFTESDLSGSVFSDCDLQRTIFRQTNLEKADFRNAFNYSIDPDLNRIKKAKFSSTGLKGLLDKYEIEIE
jgi:fluoroquinolone resistance protein